MDATARARCALEADLLEAALEVMQQCRARVLDRRELTGVSVSPATTRSVEAAARDAAVRELELATGISQSEAQTLLAVTATGGELRSMLLAVLRRGQARWSQIKTYWDRTSRARLSHDQRLIVAYALFGTDPALACEERLDPDSNLDLDTPWPYHPFLAALAREIAACQGQDPQADAQRRRRAYEQRRVQVNFHDDGTGILTMTGPAVTIAGIRHRLDVAARNLLAAGDERTLDQARFDIAAALHLHGTIDIDHIDLDTLDETLTPERLDELTALVHAQPRVHAQIIIPADALKTGLPLCPTCAEHIHPTTTSTPSDTLDLDDPNDADDLDDPDGLEDQAVNPATPWGQTTATATRPPTWADPPEAEPPEVDPPPPARASPFLDREPPGRGLVGELTGPHPTFLTPGHARELVLLPGTTLHRLLTDPADGRLIERTLTTYRPDTDMRRQVLAADRYSRAPGSRLTDRALELDHVTPWGIPGGTTTENNLAALDKRTHQAKTINNVRLQINTRRDTTFTTLLDQERATRVHDYNQYLRTAHPDDLDQRRDLANRATYAHQAHLQQQRRRTRGRSTSGDHRWTALTHTDRDTGRVRHGPHPGTPTVEDLLNIPDEDSPEDTRDDQES